MKSLLCTLLVASLDQSPKGYLVSRTPSHAIGHRRVPAMHFQNYLKAQRPSRRRALTMLLLSDHILALERLRWTKVPRHLRLSIVSPSGRQPRTRNVRVLEDFGAGLEPSRLTLVKTTRGIWFKYFTVGECGLEVADNALLHSGNLLTKSGLSTTQSPYGSHLNLGLLMLALTLCCLKMRMTCPHRKMTKITWTQVTCSLFIYALCK